MRDLLTALVMFALEQLYPGTHGRQIQAEYLYLARPVMAWLELDIQYASEEHRDEVEDALRSLERRWKPVQ